MHIKTKDDWPTLHAVIGKLARLILWGIPATGKTSAGQRFSDEDKFYSTTLHEEQEASELLGHYVPKGDRFEWQDGIATKAWRNGGTLVINEAQNASADILNILYCFADDEHVAKYTLPTGETISPHKGFRLILTTNNDPATCLNEALMSRFPVQIKVDATDPWIIEQLPERFREIASKVCDLGDTERRVDVRKWFSFAALLQAGLTQEVAGDLVFGNHWPTLQDEITLIDSPE